MVALPQDRTATVEHLLREELSRESAPAVRASRPRSAAPRSSPAANFYRRSSISCGQIRSHVSTAAGLKTRASRAAESLQRMVAHLLPQIQIRDRRANARNLGVVESYRQHVLASRRQRPRLRTRVIRKYSVRSLPQPTARSEFDR